MIYRLIQLTAVFLAITFTDSLRCAQEIKDKNELNLSKCLFQLNGQRRVYFVWLHRFFYLQVIDVGLVEQFETFGNLLKVHLVFFIVLSLIILLIKIIFKFDVKSWSIVGSWWIRTIFNLTQIPWLNRFRKTAESNLTANAHFQLLRLLDHQQKVNQRKKTKKVSCGCFQAPNRNLSFPTIYKLLKNSIHSFTYL